ncbi:MAG TPA: hypothetical protein VM033_04405 [Gemmatimonadaceae bacterium]|nr:hypothetical protein [Gemmatimonadaceae bacterium]
MTTSPRSSLRLERMELREIRPEWVIDSDGNVRVPFDRPGIGVAVDADWIDDLTVRRELLLAP